MAIKDEVFKVFGILKSHHSKWITTLALWVITMVNRGKDRKLSFRLHNLGDAYSMKPEGLWKAKGPRDSQY